MYANANSQMQENMALCIRHIWITGMDKDLTKL